MHAYTKKFTAAGLAAAVVWLVLAGGAMAAERSGQPQALALVRKAVEFMKKTDKDKAFAEFNRPDSPFNSKSEINPNGDLYMLVWQPDGIQPVHGANPKIVGKQMLEARDADGVYFIKEIIKACRSPEGKGWVNYKWPDALSKQIAAKQTYVERVGDICVGTGIYQ